MWDYTLQQLLIASTANITGAVAKRLGADIPNSCKHLANNLLIMPLPLCVLERGSSAGLPTGVFTLFAHYKPIISPSPYKR